jgi:hypothetical protein
MLAAFIVFLFQAGLDWLWQFPALVVLGLGGGAIACAASSERRARRGFAGFKWQLAAAAAAFAVGVAEIPALVATEKVRDSERALAAGDAEAARRLAGDAIKAEPWTATARAQRAFSEVSLDDLAAARDDLEDARSREPTYWRWAAALAIVDRRLHDSGAAAEAEADSKRLDRVGLQ